MIFENKTALNVTFHLFLITPNSCHMWRWWAAVSALLVSFSLLYSRADFYQTPIPSLLPCPKLPFLDTHPTWVPGVSSTHLLWLSQVTKKWRFYFPTKYKLIWIRDYTFLLCITTIPLIPYKWIKMERIKNTHTETYNQLTRKLKIKMFDVFSSV